MSTAPLLEIEHATKVFVSGRGIGGPRELVAAVDDVSLRLKPGETVALVGESGSGKSTLARLILGLQPLTSGSVRWNGTEIASMKRSEIQQFRRGAQIVFQNPVGALNPKRRIRSILGDPLRRHYGLRGTGLRARVEELLHDVGLRPPGEFLDRFPMELSGGQRQRVVIARAISLESRMLVLDEPLASLDVSIQVQILRLLDDLQKRRGLAYLLITHSLGTARAVADRVLVMYLGRIVEQGTTDGVYGSPQHPYTQALLAAVPTADPRSRGLGSPPLIGEPGSSAMIPSGCRFHPRCGEAMPVCSEDDPTPVIVSDGHAAACHLLDDTVAKAPH